MTEPADEPTNPRTIARPRSVERDPRGTVNDGTPFANTFDPWQSAAGEKPEITTHEQK